MIGKYPAKMDEKNRLFVPSKLRSELGGEFYVTLGVNCGYRCLTVYTTTDFQSLTDNYNALPVSQRSAASSLLFMNAVNCTPDKQFRFALSQFLLVRQIAGAQKPGSSGRQNSHAIQFAVI